MADPTIADLPTPALLLDLDVLERNVAAMAARARRVGVRLRPHLKTHKCVEVAQLQMRHGAVGGTVATLAEARAFIDAGLDDLTWAFPLVLSRLDEARDLARRATLRMTVDSAPQVAALEGTVPGPDEPPWRVWLKVDCGYHRAGVDPASDALVAFARRLANAPHVVFEGILSHSGHAYDTPGREARAAVAEEERAVMVAAKARLEDAGVSVPAVSVGSTPAMTAAESLEGIDEARPGNYVFYDRTQVVLGSCGVADCAVTVLASVVSSPPGADHAVVDAGALALSKDPGFGTPETMGEILHPDPPQRLAGNVRVVSLSQEHGKLDRPLPAGNRLRILPNHSCLTVACFDHYVCVRGDRVQGRWTIHRDRD